jgi:hypothetical protein
MWFYNPHKYWHFNKKKTYFFLAPIKINISKVSETMKGRNSKFNTTVLTLLLRLLCGGFVLFQKDSRNRKCIIIKNRIINWMHARFREPDFMLTRVCSSFIHHPKLKGRCSRVWCVRLSPLDTWNRIADKSALTISHDLQTWCFTKSKFVIISFFFMEYNFMVGYLFNFFYRTAE